MRKNHIFMDIFYQMLQCLITISLLCHFQKIAAKSIEIVEESEEIAALRKLPKLYKVIQNPTFEENLNEIVNTSLYQQITNLGYYSVILVIGIPSSSKNEVFDHLTGENLVPVLINSSYKYLPKAVIDKSINTVYFNCPDYAPITLATEEVAVKYFLKGIIENALAVKVIAVTSKKSVTNNTGDFLTLTNYTSRFINHLSMFKFSLGFVVSQVQMNETNKQFKQSLKGFISKVKSQIVPAFESIEDVHYTTTKYLSDSIVMLAIMDTKKQEAFQRVAILRTSKTSSLKDRVHTYALVMQTLKYIERNEDDFWYKLSKKTHSTIEKYVDNINKGFANKIIKITETIYERIRKYLQSYPDIIKTKDSFYNQYHELSKMVRWIKIIKNPREFLYSFIYTFARMNIKIPRAHIEVLYRYSRHFNTLQYIYPETLQVSPQVWIKPLEDKLKFLQTEKIWYTFLVKLYDRFSEFDVQINVEKYNVKYISDWGKPGKAQGIFINNNNVKEFLKKISKFNILYHSYVMHFEITIIKLKTLNDVLKQTLRTPVKYECLKEAHSKTLIISGDFIRLQQLKFDKACPGMKMILIYAWHTIFIDKDLDFVGKEISLGIVAPIWHIIALDKGRVFNLTGGDAEPLGKATTGADGVTGLPGQPGGCFYGAGKEFKNGRHLSVITSGGHGGPGQAGGDGAPGTPGAATKFPAASKDRYTESQGIDVFKNNKYERFEDTRKYFQNKSRTWNLKVHTTFFIIFGNSGTKGGNAGNGGTGGSPGLANNVFIETLNDIQKVKHRGSRGASGAGGRGGAGGVGGNNVYLTNQQWAWCNLESKSKDYNSSVWSNVLRNDQSSVVEEGLDGKSSTKDHKRVNARAPYCPLDYTKLIYLYKSRLRMNLDGLKTEKMLNFYQILDTNSVILNQETFYEMTNEFKELEMDYIKLGPSQMLFKIYKRLYDRISQYAVFSIHNQNPFNSTTVKDLIMKKTMTLLYTSILSKMCSIRYSFDRHYVSSYKIVEETLQNVEIIKDMDASTMLEEDLAYLSNVIEVRASDLAEFIKHHLVNEGDFSENYVNLEVESQVDRLLQLQKESKGDNTESKIRKAHLLNNLKLKSLFSYMKIFTVIIDFYNSFSQGILKLIGASNLDLTYLVLDSSNIKPRTFPSEIQTAIIACQGFFEEIAAKLIVTFDDQLNALLKSTRLFPELHTKLLRMVTKYKTKLEVVKKDRIFNLDHVIQLKKELRAEMSKLNSPLVASFNKTTRIVDLSFSISSKYVENSDAINLLSDIINQDVVAAETLIDFRQIIYRFGSVKINEYGASMANLKGNYARYSIFDVEELKLPSILMDMKELINKVTYRFLDNEDLKRLVYNSYEAIELSIRIYNRLEHYQRIKFQLDHITDLNSEKSLAIAASNQKENASICFLNRHLQNNILMEQLNRAIYASIQTNFPFGDRFAKEYRVPNYLSIDMELPQVIKIVKKKLEQITKLEEETMRYLSNTNFTQSAFTAHELFVWQNRYNKVGLSRLFDGSEVTFRAHPSHNLHNESAVKFHSIHIEFVAHDPSMQQELDLKLNHFDMQMRHSGHSFYRCEDSFFEVNSDPRTVYFSFERGSNGLPLRTNDAPVTEKRWTAMLSPYAVWSLRMVKDSYAFSMLDYYKDKVDMHLAGHVFFLTNTHEFCNEKLNEYYAEIDKVSDVQDLHLDYIPKY